MVEREINFFRPPKDETYGTVAVFENLYGNLWNLLEPKINKLPDKQLNFRSSQF
jgi:hypothetical protein